MSGVRNAQVVPRDPSVLARVESLRAWLQQAPAGTMVSAAAVLAHLEDPPVAHASPAITPAAPSSWRERLWVVPAETRLGVAELMEAVNRPKSWVHRHTSPKSGVPQLPARKLDGTLVFVAGEIRAWLEEHELRTRRPPGPRFSRTLAGHPRFTR